MPWNKKYRLNHIFENRRISECRYIGISINLKSLHFRMSIYRNIDVSIYRKSFKTQNHSFEHPCISESRYLGISINLKSLHFRMSIYRNIDVSICRFNLKYCHAHTSVILLLKYIYINSLPPLGKKVCPFRIYPYFFW